MKKQLSILSLFSAALLCAAPATPAKAPATPAKAPAKAASKKASPKVKITCTPAGRIVKEGEQVKFSITSDSQLPIAVTISLDGSSQKVFKTAEVKSPAEITASLDYPGFLHCSAQSGRTVVKAGVAVSPEKIRYKRQAPADFKEFWESALKESAKLPLDLKVEPVKPHSEFESYLVSCANVNGKRAYAFYSAPKKRTKKMPLVVLFGGGEAYITALSVPSVARRMSKRFNQPTAVLYLHLPPYPPADTWEEARKIHTEFLKKLGLRRYILVGLDNPRKYYAYPTILGALRLINAVMERPEIDKEQLFFHGASHGGKIGAYMAYFLPFRAVFLGVPSSCEINAFLEGRYGSAAKEATKYPQTTEYFDLVHFAPGIKCHVLVGVGFHDRSCPPTGVYSFYNALPEGKKKIMNKISNGHGDAPAWYIPESWKFLSDRQKK